MSSVVDEPIDVLVIGAGPAGASAAIWTALGGLRVALLHRDAHRPRPGETLHPGAGAVLRQLGVEETVAAASRVRHAGISTDWAGATTVQRFGDEGIQGYQIRGVTLDAILVEHARSLGVTIVPGDAPMLPLVEGGRVEGITMSGSALRARHVVDATGAAAWLPRRLGIGWRTSSPRFRVRYGYCRGRLIDELPALHGDRDGWSWIAQIDDARIAWTRLWFARPAEYSPPHDLAGFEHEGAAQAADMAWRCSTSAAGPGYFLVGDAACSVDPSSSHGVLRAVMSGMMAAHAIREVRCGLDEPRAIAGHQRWITRWFDADVRRLDALYRALDPEWQSTCRLAEA